MPHRTFTRIGTHHVNQCEDAVGYFDIGENRSILVVSDGCSMGNYSHFAAELTIKSIKAIAKEEFYKEYVSSKKLSLTELLRLTLQKLIDKYIKIKSFLNLETYDLLATVGLAIVDTAENEAIFTVVGDGLVVIDDQLIEFDNDNAPDYLAYHLADEFAAWHSKLHVQSESVNHYIALSTDGIYTFADEYDSRLSDGRHSTIIRKIIMSSDTSVGERPSEQS